MSLCTPLCCLVATMHLFSQSFSIVLQWGSAAECHLNLLERQVYLVARLCPYQSFFCCVIDVVLLHCVCCTRLIRTRIIVCSVSFHLRLSEFDISDLRMQLIHYSLKCQGVPAQTRVCGKPFPTLFDTQTLDGFKRAVNHWLLP